MDVSAEVGQLEQQDTAAQDKQALKYVVRRVYKRRLEGERNYTNVFYV